MSDLYRSDFVQVHLYTMSLLIAHWVLTSSSFRQGEALSVGLLWLGDDGRKEDSDGDRATSGVRAAVVPGVVMLVDELGLRPLLLCTASCCYCAHARRAYVANADHRVGIKRAEFKASSDA